MKFLKYSELDKDLLQQYRNAIAIAFPKIILSSELMKKCWEKLEQFFPQLQIFLVNEENQLVGFMNTVPLFWDQPMPALPDKGWDWMVQKAISDHTTNEKPNTIGGLQIIVLKKYQGQGYSKVLIAEGKKVKSTFGFQHFIIPIRPILKHKHPEMLMKDYIQLRKENNIYDPWIRTHVNSGAEIIKVCEKSMSVTGTISFWETIIQDKITKSGSYYAEGALNSISIDMEKDFGEYQEENIWIQY